MPCKPEILIPQYCIHCGHALVIFRRKHFQDETNYVLGNRELFCINSQCLQGRKIMPGSNWVTK
jgi:hypothetical protein